MKVGIVRELASGETRVALVPHAPNSDAGFFSHGAPMLEWRAVGDALVREYSIEHHPLQSILPLHAEVR